VSHVRWHRGGDRYIVGPGVRRRKVRMSISIQISDGNRLWAGTHVDTPRDVGNESTVAVAEQHEYHSDCHGAKLGIGFAKKLVFYGFLLL
jgi:hypothetical protein